VDAAVTDRNRPRSQDEEESRRILDRVARESDSGGLSQVGGVLGAARRRIEADMPAGADPIDYWGTRIGRFLGLLITLAIVGWLLLYLFGGI
jgi:hypothetical protein